MPVSLTTLFRAAVVLAMAWFVFLMDLFARAMNGVVGMTPSGLVGLSLYGLLFLLPLVWAVALPDLPEMLRRQAGRRRFERGRCGACGYPLGDHAGVACPECGAPRRPPEPFSFGWPIVRRFVLLALVAWVLGCTAAETWAWLDEQSFAVEAAKYTGPGAYSRPRRWPDYGARLWDVPGEGISGRPPGGGRQG